MQPLLRGFARFSTVFLIAVAALCSLAQAALADVDPASDVLLLQSVYRPYGPPYAQAMCKELSDGLDTLTEETQKAGYPLKVAIIASKVDLGGAPQVWKKPQAYSEFLSRELAFFGRKKIKAGELRPLLVVMPAGFGVTLAGPRAQAALKDVSIPPDAKVNKLARAATDAIPKLASAAGHPIKPLHLGSACHTGGGGTSPLVFAAPLLALVVITAIVALVRNLRSRRRPDSPDAE
jgi:hypothetical protein